MKSAALYARVSSEEQVDSKTSIDSQLADMDHHCQRQGYQIVSRYIDIQSGTDSRRYRAQFETMLADAKQHKFDLILVWRPDRLFRGLKPAAKLASLLDSTGIDIEAVLQPLDRYMIGLWAWVAEQELVTMKQRFRAAKRANAAQLGKWPGGGFVKYGYKYNVDRKSLDYTGKLEVDKKEAEVVRGLFEWIDQGKTAASWCRWANKQSIATKRNAPGWTAQALSEMLRDHTYTGRGAYGKLTRRGNKLVTAHDPVPMAYPAIIDDALFERVQVKLAANKKNSPGAARHIYLLQHLGRCGECGGPLCCTVNSYGCRYSYCLNQRRFPYIYKCYDPQNWHMEPIEDSLWAEVEDILDNYQHAAIDKLVAEYDATEQNLEATIAKARNELERCQQERQRLLTALRKAYGSEAELDLQFRAIKADQEQWGLELARAEAVRANINKILDSIHHQVGKVLQAIDWSWDTTMGFSIGQKKDILNAVLDKFVLYKDGRIELRLRVPVNQAQVAIVILRV